MCVCIYLRMYVCMCVKLAHTMNKIKEYIALYLGQTVFYKASSWCL